MKIILKLLIWAGRMLIDDFNFFKKYNSPIDIKYKNIIFNDPDIWTAFRRGDLQQLKKLYAQVTYKHLFMILKNIDINMNWICMDYCCGVGRMAKEIINFCFKIVAIDYDDNLVEYAKKMNKDLNIDFGVIRNGYINRRPESIDFIYSILSFQYFDIDKTEKILKKLGEILKTGGLMRFQFATQKVNDYKQAWNKRAMIELCEKLGFIVYDYNERLGQIYWDWITLKKEKQLEVVNE